MIAPQTKSEFPKYGASTRLAAISTPSRTPPREEDRRRGPERGDRAAARQGDGRGRPPPAAAAGEPARSLLAQVRLAAPARSRAAPSPGPRARSCPSPARSRGCAASSAISAFCSTSRIGVPCALISRDDLEDLLDEDRREPHRRLVEQQQLRAAPSARGPIAHHLLLAAGHRPRLLLLPLGEPREEVEDAVHVLLEVRPVGRAGRRPSRGSRARTCAGRGGGPPATARSRP